MCVRGGPCVLFPPARGTTGWMFGVRGSLQNTRYQTFGPYYFTVRLKICFILPMRLLDCVKGMRIGNSHHGPASRNSRLPYCQGRPLSPRSKRR